MQGRYTESDTIIFIAVVLCLYSESYLHVYRDSTYIYRVASFQNLHIQTIFFCALSYQRMLTSQGIKIIVYVRNTFLLTQMNISYKET